MKVQLALTAVVLGLIATPSYGVSLGLQSSNPKNARVYVTHSGTPVRVRIVVVDENFRDLSSQAMPSTLVVSRNTKPRKSFIKLPEGAFAVCARVEPSIHNDDSVAMAYQSCQKIREKGKATRGLSDRLGAGLSGITQTSN